MNGIRIYFTLLSFLLFLSSYGQQQTNIIESIKIDKKIKEKVDRKVSLEQSDIYGLFDLKIYKNDTLVFDTYQTNQSLKTRISATLIGSDTIAIIGNPHPFYGFEIMIINDKVSVLYKQGKLAGNSYRLQPNEFWKSKIAVPCKSYNLTLVKKPEFRSKEELEGIVELQSDEYYELANSSVNKLKVSLTGYFKTEKLPFLKIP